MKLPTQSSSVIREAITTSNWLGLWKNAIRENVGITGNAFPPPSAGNPLLECFEEIYLKWKGCNNGPQRYPGECDDEYVNDHRKCLDKYG